MAEHGRVVVVPHDAAWTVEGSLITEPHAPLNLRNNAAHACHAELTALREGARSAAGSVATRDAG
ncbi:hypothetical protein E2C06_03395 [Dankookia rubra]|uniref:Uncharacterized protein n=1 Tax=Dankookia rubra TaxID=1442381 RepID=A0A4R5QLA0_9PROT|nr:hypothetical protein [Dankookia rubra]TDH63893.1 hypothetical protein E2C06_03395 [Dankookia rubra]